MATDETILKLLELYQKSKLNGDNASLFLETRNGKDVTITFNIKNSAGNPAEDASLSRKRWKTPSQLRRDKERKDIFLAKKLKESNISENIDTKTKEETTPCEKVLLMEPFDEINLEVQETCAKVFVIPKIKINNHNIGIEVDVSSKLKAKGLNVKQVVVHRFGDPIRGEYSRSEAFIEPTDVKLIEQESFEIENCWVLPDT